MDWGNVITALITATTVLIPFWLKWSYEKKKDREAAAKKDKADKAAAEKIAQELKIAAEKVEIERSTQLHISAEKLAKSLEAAADKLAKEHVRQIEEREQRYREEQELIKKKKSLTYLMDIDREVSHKTKHIVRTYNALRSYVIHLSDEVITEANLHLLKVTFLHESVVDWSETRVEAVSKAFKETHMPEMFKSPMYRLLKEGEYYLKNTADIDIKDVHKRDYHDWLTAYKVKSCLWLPIRSSTGVITAVLVVQWSQPTDFAGTILAKIRDVNRLIEQVYNESKPKE